MENNHSLVTHLEVFDDISKIAIPSRQGTRPTTTCQAPHSQLDQNAPVQMQNRLRDYALSLPGVRKGPSKLSVPGTVAFFLDHPSLTPLISDWDWEWGHIHPSYDGSLHINLPPATARRIIELGWAEFHYLVSQKLLPPIIIMLYGPRDEQELAICSRIIDASYLAAGGDLRRKLD